MLWLGTNLAAVTFSGVPAVRADQDDHDELGPTDETAQGLRFRRVRGSGSGAAGAGTDER